MPMVKTTCEQGDRLRRRPNELAEWKIVHTDRENDLPTGRPFMPASKTSCRLEERLRRQQERFAVVKIVAADGVSDFPSSAKTVCEVLTVWRVLYSEAQYDTNKPEGTE